MVAGCGIGAPASPSATATPNPSAAATYCQGVVPRTPNGDRVDLTGTWLGEDDQTYYSFIQVGDCVTAVGTGGPNAEEVLVLHGTMAPDLTIPVEWAHVPVGCRGAFCGGEIGTAVLEIEIENTPDGEVITLRKVGGNTGQDRGPNMGVTRWTRVTDDAVSPSPTPGT